MHQVDRNTTFCPPANIQVISHIKHKPQVRNRNVLHQKYVVEGLSINQIAALSMSSRSTVRKHLLAHGISIRPEDSQIGGPGFGQKRRGGINVPNQVELEILEKVKQLKVEGVSNQKIADILISLKIPTKRGGKWCRRSVRNLLMR